MILNHTLKYELDEIYLRVRKMADTTFTQQNIQLFNDLNRFGQNGDYERALKIANKILSGLPEDEKVFQYKVICLMQLGSFDEALRCINKNSKLANNLTFEKAYCEYRLNKVEEAYKTLQSVNNLDYRHKELLGQVLYRLENFKYCFQVYKDLIKNSDDDYEEERQTNLSAVLVGLEAEESGNTKDDDLLDDSYELCYNAACVLLTKGKFQKAEKKLRRAEDLCKKTFEDADDMTEEDIESELAIIRVQLGYVLQIQGKVEEAMKLYSHIIKLRPADIGLLAVASNNVVTLNKDQNVFDSKKKMKIATVEGLDHKLTKYQQKCIAFNQCLLLLLTNQHDQCKKMIKLLQAKYPNMLEPVLISAAEYCRNNNLNSAVQVLQDCGKKDPEQSLNIQLVLAQLYLTQGKISLACETLQELDTSLKYKPGVVSALVTLYLYLEDRDTASLILNDAVSWYKKNNVNSKQLTSLIQGNAKFQLKYGKAELAAAMLEDLRKIYPKDVKVLAQLITAYSQFDPISAQKVSKNLPPSSDMSFDVDVDVLETGQLTMSIKKKTTKEITQQANHFLVQKKKRKKKKGKLPKNYDPNVDPDCERWLPKRERSYYAKKRKDKRIINVGKGTQGTTTGGSNEMDLSKPSSLPNSPRPGSQVVQPITIAGPRLQKPQGANRKKKKKVNKK